MKIRNLFEHLDDAEVGEVFLPLVHGRTARLERIVSAGQTTPPGEWLQQPEDEWVAVLQGRASLRLQGDDHDCHLRPGDHVLIPGGTPHRVTQTSHSPPTVWLALHFTAVAVDDTPDSEL